MIERITTTRELTNGNMSEGLTAKMREVNLNPTFNKKEKPWSLVKIPKSTTKNVAWHIRIEGNNILAIQVCNHNPNVVFYECTDKAAIKSWGSPLATYGHYVDLEAAVDKFYNENYAPKNEDESTGADA